MYLLWLILAFHLTVCIVDFEVMYFYLTSINQHFEWNYHSIELNVVRPQYKACYNEGVCLEQQL